MLGLVIVVASPLRESWIGGIVWLSAVPIGGLAYRAQSRNWQRDPMVRRKQVLLSILAILVPTIVLGVIVSFQDGDIRVVSIGLIVGVAVAVGILCSGTRQFKKGATTRDEII